MRVLNPVSESELVGVPIPEKTPIHGIVPNKGIKRCEDIEGNIESFMLVIGVSEVSEHNQDHCGHVFACVDSVREPQTSNIVTVDALPESKVERKE